MKTRMGLIVGLCMVFMFAGQSHGTGHEVTGGLRIDALIHTESGLTEAVFHEGGEDVTARGDSVVWGYFHADPEDVSWGSENNPEVYVKIWFDISGRIDVNFFHVSVPEITVFSAYPWGGAIYDNHDTLSTDDRYVRHEYHLRRWTEFYTYDADANMTKEEYDRDGDGIIDLTRAYTFTKDGDTTTREGEIDIDGDGITDYFPTETFTYDADGNLLKHESDSFVRTYAYDERGNQTKMQYELETFIHDADGNLTRRLFNTWVHTYAYDDRGNQTKARHESESFAYDADGNLTKHESDVSVQTCTLFYDDHGNITKKETDSHDGGTTDAVCMYAYDADGNMTKEVCDQQTELGTIHTAYAYNYDAAGNRVKKEYLDKHGNVTSSRVFTYDADGNLIREEPVSKNQGKIYSNHTTYAYDADGNLIRKAITGNLGGCLGMPSIPEDLPVGVYETSWGTVVNIPPLPDSTKGYELYSWPSEGEWHFTLITGTDRLKTYKEICSDENVVSEDGWVKITVTGVRAVKSMVSSLPWKASIFWLNRDLDGDQGDMPDLSFPDAETVDEIKAYCEQREFVLEIPALNARKGFNIYLASESMTDEDIANIDITQVELESEPILSDEDILVYLQEEHIMQLTQEGRQKLSDSTRVKNGEAFFACVGDKPVYAGVLWSAILSFPPQHSEFMLIFDYPDHISITDYKGTSISGDDPRSDSGILTALRNSGKLGTSSVNVNDAILLSDNFFSEWEDPFSIRSASIQGDTLRLLIFYTAGFKEHDFRLAAKNGFMESYPVQAEIMLAHNANGDSGEVSIEKELTSDLSRLRAEYQRQYPDDKAGRIILRIQSLMGYQTLEYNFDDREPLNFDIVEKEGIEYFLHTDKAAYIPDESVKIQYDVTNISDSVRTLGVVPRGCEYEFFITHEEEEVWRSCRVIPPCGFEEFSLNPGESRGYERVWDMTDDNGTFESHDDFSITTEGTYVISGEMRLMDEEERIPVRLDIEIREPDEHAVP